MRFRPVALPAPIEKGVGRISAELEDQSIIRTRIGFTVITARQLAHRPALCRPNIAWLTMAARYMGPR